MADHTNVIARDITTSSAERFHDGGIADATCGPKTQAVKSHIHTVRLASIDDRALESAAPRLTWAANFNCKGRVIPNPASAISLVQAFSSCERSQGDCKETANRMIFGFRERNAREKAVALN